MTSPAEATGARTSVAPQVVSRPMIAIATAFLLGAVAAPAEHVALVVGALVGSSVVTLLLAVRGRILSTFVAPLPFFLAGLVVATLRAPGAGGVGVDGEAILEGVIAEDPDPDLLVDLARTSTAPGADWHSVQGRARISAADEGSGAWACGVVGQRVRVVAEEVRPVASRRRLAARRGVTFEGRAASVRACVAIEPPSGLARVIDAVRAPMRERSVAVGQTGPTPGVERVDDRPGPTLGVERVDGRPGPRSGVERVDGRPGPRSGVERVDGRPGPRSGVERVDGRPGRTSGEASSTPLLAAVLVGRRTADLAPFRAAGLAHLLYLRGLVLVALFFALERALAALLRRLDRSDRPIARKRALAGTALLAGLVLVFGPSPTILRAASIPFSFLLAPLLARPSDAWSSLGISAVVCTLADPASLGDPEFQLAFAGTAAVARALSLTPAGGLGLELLYGSGAVVLGLGPLAARHFAPLPLAGYLIGSAVANPLTVLTAAAGLLARAVPPLSGIAEALDASLVEVASFAAGWAGGVALPKPSAVACLAYYAVLIGSFAALSRRARGKTRAVVDRSP